MIELWRRYGKGSLKFGWPFAILSLCGACVCDLEASDRVVDKLEGYAFVVPTNQNANCKCIVPKLDSIFYVSPGETISFNVRLVHFDELQRGLSGREVHVDLVDSDGRLISGQTQISPQMGLTNANGFVSDVFLMTVALDTPIGTVLRIRMQYRDRAEEGRSFGPFIYVEGP